MFCNVYFSSETKSRLQLLTEDVFFLICAKENCCFISPSVLLSTGLSELKNLDIHTASLKQ